MAQLSRPYQIALAALGLFAVVWVFALRSHSTSSTGSSAAPAAPVQSAAAKPAATTPAKATSPIYHGSAPGVQGLTRAIAKAHGAVATSEQNAKQLAERSSQASNANATPSSSATTPSATHAATGAVTTAKAPAVGKSAPVVGHPAPRAGIRAQSGSGRTPARQALVERALNEGKIAVILFWNKQGADDRAVRFELRLLEAVHHDIAPVAHTPQVRHELQLSGLELQKKIATFEATPKQVSSFGSITRGVQVYSTPTILIVAKGGKTTVITGLTDAYSIEQAIDETRHS